MSSNPPGDTQNERQRSVNQTFTKAITSNPWIIKLATSHTLSALSLIVVGAILHQVPEFSQSKLQTNYSLTEDDAREHHRVVCVSLLCSTHIALACIASGIIFMFCSFSTILLSNRHIKEYICCHLTWLSITALSSVCLILMTIIGSEDASVKARICIFIAIATCGVEMAVCVCDVCLVNNMIIVRNAIEKQRTTQQQPEPQTATTNEQETSNNSPAPIMTSPTILISEESVQRSSTRRSRDAGSRRREDRRGQSSGSRLSSGQSRGNFGRIRRDRNRLHPNYNSRQRNRARPMLRGQNHYISVPVSLSAHSTGFHPTSPLALGPRSRGNSATLPMFIITASPTSQVLRQEPVAMTTNIDKDKSIQKPEQDSEKQDTRADASEVKESEAAEEETAASECQKEAKEVKKTPLLRKKAKDGAMYSIVRRSKEGGLEIPTSENNDTLSSETIDVLPQPNGIVEEKVKDVKCAREGARGGRVDSASSGCEIEKITTFASTLERSYSKRKTSMVRLDISEFVAEKEATSSYQNLAPAHPDEGSANKKKRPQYENVDYLFDQNIIPKIPPRS